MSDPSVAAAAFLAAARTEFEKQRRMAERAVAQVAPDDLVRALDGETNSIALVMKHMAGNMHSRWSDFFTSDGEKPGRDRDSEFVLTGDDTRERLRARWDRGYELLFATLAQPEALELGRTVFIRREPHTVLQAVLRQIAHYGYHVGQIVLLARHFSGSNWETLSVARGKSREYDPTRQP